MDRANGSLLLESELPERCGARLRSYNPRLPMKTAKPAQKPDDIELIPDAWDRFTRAVKALVPHKPVEHPTGHGKGPKRRSAVVRKRKR